MEEVRDIFERYGPVRDVYMPKDFHSGQVPRAPHPSAKTPKCPKSPKPSRRSREVREQDYSRCHVQQLKHQSKVPEASVQAEHQTKG